MKKRVVAEPLADEEAAVAAGEVQVVRVIGPAPRQGGGDGYLLLGLLAGAAWGAVAGLLLAPRKGDVLRARLLGQADPAPRLPDAPAEARDAVAQVLQYTSPTAAESARQTGPAAPPTTRAPGL